MGVFLFKQLTLMPISILTTGPTRYHPHMQRCRDGSWDGMLTYPTRRYPGTVLAFPLSFTSLTTTSAVPRGISFTHMRFFLDTEASGSRGRE